MDLRNMSFVLLIVSLMLIQAFAEEYEGYYGHGHQLQGGYGGDEHEVDYHAYPKYRYDYSVKDPHTGDNKDAWETRDGDKVKGQYSLLDADGTKRIVEYESDKHNGFNAVVHKIGKPKEYKEVHHQYESQEEHGGYFRPSY